MNPHNYEEKRDMKHYYAEKAKYRRYKAEGSAMQVLGYYLLVILLAVVASVVFSGCVRKYYIKPDQWTYSTYRPNPAFKRPVYLEDFKPLDTAALWQVAPVDVAEALRIFKQKHP